MRLRPAAFLLCTFAGLAGCGGGGKAGAPILPAPAPTSSSASSHGTGKAAASFVITIPKANPTPAGALRPAYVSPATQSMTVTIMQGSTQVSSQTVGLTTGSSGCTSSLANVTCTLTLNLNAGTYTASIATYDGANGTGNELSTAQNVSFTVVADESNVVPLSLSGIPASIVVLPGSTADSVYVLALDADGNFIVGSGAPTFAASKASGATVASITQPTSTAPNTIAFAALSPVVPGTETVSVNASYPSGETNACAASGAVCGLASPITLTSSGGMAFLANYENNNTLGYTLPLTSNTQAPAVTIGSLDYPYGGVAVNSSGTLFTWGYGASGSFAYAAPPYTSPVTISLSSMGLLGGYTYYQGAAAPNGYVFVPEYSGSGAVGIVAPPYTSATQLTAGISGVYGAATDSNSNLYVANESGDDVTVYASPYTAVSVTLPTAQVPYGVAVSGGKLIVTEDNGLQVFTLPVNSSSTPVTLSFVGTSYSAATTDAKGDVWVACYSSCASSSDGEVDEYTAPLANGNTPAVTLQMPATGFTSYYPTGIGFDAAGNLYVENEYGGAEEGGLLEYSGTITSSSTPAYGVETSALYYPFGMAFAPATFSVTP